MTVSLSVIAVPQRVGGELCLDFVNTVDYWNRTHELDYFADYAHILAWYWRVGLLDETEAQEHYAIATAQPAAELIIVQAVHELRQVLATLFATLIEQQELQPKDLEALNRLMVRLAPYQHLVTASHGCRWNWDTSDHPVADLLGPITLAAADLLTSSHLHQLRQCPRCGWFFLDTSRNRRRRWCSMRLCGNKVKSRRQYERKHQQSPEMMP